MRANNNKISFKKYKIVSSETRKLICINYDSGKSISELSQIYDVKESTIRSICKRFDSTGSTEPSSKGGDHRSRLSEDQKSRIIQWVDEDATISLLSLKKKVFETYNLTISISTIDRILKNFHYTLKNSTIVPNSRNTERTVELRYHYAFEFENIEVEYSSENIVFLDEVGFQLSTRCKKARSKKGTPARVSTPVSRSRNISVLAAMNKNELLFKKIRFSAFNGEVFKQSLLEIYELCTSKNILNPIFILDNARIHHYRGLMDLTSQNGIKLQFLPPYSPFLNPIENVFSIWKNQVIRSQCSNEEDLIKEINDSFENFDNRICENLYRRMRKYIAFSRERKIIFE